MLSHVKRAIVAAAISLSEVTGASQYIKIGLILNKSNNNKLVVNKIKMIISIILDGYLKDKNTCNT